MQPIALPDAEEQAAAAAGQTEEQPQDAESHEENERPVDPAVDENVAEAEGSPVGFEHPRELGQNGEQTVGGSTAALDV